MSSSNKPFLALREKAIRVLTLVLSDGMPFDLAIESEAGTEPPEGRAWLLEVVSGVLRWKGRLDFLIDSLATKKKPSGWLRKALLVASAQILLHDRVAPGAVVSETVDLIKKREGTFPAGFANALLRRVVESASSWKTLEFPKGRPDAQKAAWASLPLWFWKRLAADQGEDWAERFCRVGLERPTLWVRAQDETWAPDWAERGPLPFSWKDREGGGVFEKKGFKEGNFIVQDLSSQRLVLEMSEIVRAGRPALPKVLDLCAAPGGKAIGLSWSGFDVTASDRSEDRLSLVFKNRDRTRAPHLRVVPPEKLGTLPKASFDWVWIDAPCTGSGIVGRHPDIRWLKKEADIGQLAKIQRELIREGSAFVAPGGFLAYSVCSVFKQEGESHLAALKEIGDVKKTWGLGADVEFPGDGFWAALVQMPL